MTASARQRHFPRSPSCIPPSCGGRGHRAGAGDRWRRRAPPRVACATGRCSSSTWWRSMARGGWSQEHLPQSRGLLLEHPRLQLTVGDGIAWVAAAARRQLRRGDRRRFRPRPARSEGLFNRAFFRALPRRNPQAPAASSPPRARIARGSARCTSNGCGCWREVFRHAIPSRLGAIVPSGWWTLDLRRQRTAPVNRQPDAARAASCRRRAAEIWSPRC